MDETPGSAANADAPYAEEVVARNRWFQLVDTETGYGIWPAGSDRGESAVEVFEDEGFEAAEVAFRQRTRQMRAYVTAPRWLARVVFVIAPLWVLVSATGTIWLWLGNINNKFFNESGSFPPAWIQYAQQISYAIWIGALACLIALYLYRRASEARGG
jgi:hypothetical protein